MKRTSALKISILRKNEDVKLFLVYFPSASLYFVLFLSELQKCILDCPVPVKCY